MQEAASNHPQPSTIRSNKGERGRAAVVQSSAELRRRRAYDPVLCFRPSDSRRHRSTITAAQRRALLRELIPRLGDPVRHSETFDVPAAELLTRPRDDRQEPPLGIGENSPSIPPWGVIWPPRSGPVTSAPIRPTPTTFPGNSKLI